MNRIEMIKTYKENKDNEELLKSLEKEKRISEYYKQIEELKPRMIELLEVGKACQKNGITLVSSFNYERYDTHQFISNGWSHLTGFVDNLDIYEHRKYDYNWLHSHTMDWKKEIGGFGKIGGGACWYNLTIKVCDDGLDILCTGEEKEHALKNFIKDFDEFEEEFYKYVDRICKGE